MLHLQSEDDFDPFYKTALPLLFRLARIMGHNEADSADFAQEALVKTWGHWSKLLPENRYRYASKCLMSVRADYFRYRKVRTAKQPQLWIPEPANSVESQIEDNIDAERALKFILSALSSRERTVLILAWCGWNPAEIGNQLKITTKCVDSTLYNARKKVKNYL